MNNINRHNLYESRWGHARAELIEAEDTIIKWGKRKNKGGNGRGGEGGGGGGGGEGGGGEAN